MYYVGLDLGQRRDHTALAVVERREAARQTYYSPRGFQPDACQSGSGTRWWVRHVERAPLGTPYPRVVEQVRRLVRHRDLQGRCALVVDATGVGAPVVEMLRAAQLGCEISAVTITGGERETQHRGTGGTVFHVPKQDLLAGVQVLLEQGELKIAGRLREMAALMRELMDIRATVSGTGRVRLGADGGGEHDDLAIALALACWRGRRKQLTFGTRRLPGI